MNGFENYPDVLTVLAPQKDAARCGGDAANCAHFVVNRDLFTVTVKDPRIVSVLPNSGGFGVGVPVSVGAGLILLGVFVLVRHRRWDDTRM